MLQPKVQNSARPTRVVTGGLANAGNVILRYLWSEGDIRGQLTARQIEAAVVP